MTKELLEITFTRQTGDEMIYHAYAYDIWNTVVLWPPLATDDRPEDFRGEIDVSEI
ncbi:MAG: hypothetical protein M3008_03640 [Chloroflexota bacterium]|nr:hypothetical protein [Chloroflexota bacterium]